MEPKIEPRVGMHARNIAHPEWGPGKVVAADDQHFYVFFRDDQGKTAIESRRARRFARVHADRFEWLAGLVDELLANLPPFVREGADYLLPHERLTIASAKKKLFDIFPGGLLGADYIGDRKRGERAYKVAAHDLYVESLGNGQLDGLLAAGDVAEAAKRARKIVGATNLLHATESAAFADALAVEAGASAYLASFSRLLRAPAIDAAAFEDYLRGFFALPRVRGRVHTWVVCTALPFLAQPHRFMHLKPEETTVAASRLAFDLRYDSTPNWTTYDRLLVLSDVLKRELVELGCRDMIDVQSFIHITCGGYDPKPKKVKA